MPECRCMPALTGPKPPGSPRPKPMRPLAWCTAVSTHQCPERTRSHTLSAAMVGEGSLFGASRTHGPHSLYPYPSLLILRPCTSVEPALSCHPMPPTMLLRGLLTLFPITSDIYLQQCMPPHLAFFGACRRRPHCNGCADSCRAINLRLGQPCVCGWVMLPR